MVRSPVVARRRPLVRRAALARAHRGRRSGSRGRMDGGRDRIADHAAGGATSRIARCAPRARSRRATARFIGSWRFRKCSSTLTAGCSPDGGFDAVLGNPPWDMVRADTGSAAASRRRLEPARRRRLRFYRDSRAYSLQGNGHANRYQLFLERALRLTETGRTRRADPALGHRAPITAARRCASICSIAPRSTRGLGSTIAGASFRFTAACGSWCCPRRTAGAPAC